VIIDFARRAHDHNWEMIPLRAPLLDTDFYKLLMLQFIWKNFPRTRATFTLISIAPPPLQLGEIVSVGPNCAEQLEATRRLRFRKSELVWLARKHLLRPPRDFSNPHFSIGSSTNSSSPNSSFRPRWSSFSFNSKASGQELRVGRSTLSLTGKN